MSVAKVNFELKSDLMAVQRRDIPVADKNLTNPYHAAALFDGEWLTINAAGKLVRSADITQAAGTAAAGDAVYLSCPLFAERGRYDVRANAENKMPVFWLANEQYEAQTRIFDAALGAGITAVGQPLKVAVIELTTNGATRKYSGLMRHGGAGDAAPVFGYVTKLPTNGWLRFKSGTRNF